MTIIFRVDCDYAYSSRIKSFLAVFLRVKLGKGYLENSKIIARMINQSQKDVKVFWFFTTQTLPDVETLNLLNNSKHEVCLHYVKDLNYEWVVFRSHLAKLGYKKFCWFYNKHGVARLFTKMVWHKFIDKPNLSSILIRFDDDAINIDQNGYFFYSEVYHFHPDWLFNNGLFSKHVRFYEKLKNILCV